MEKKRYEPVGRSKNERIGVPTGLLDKEGNELLSGDFISMPRSYRALGKRVEMEPYAGPVLWHRECACWGLFYGCWYRNHDIYDAKSYGKFIPIPSDNGMRMEISKLSELPEWAVKASGNYIRDVFCV